MIRKYCDLSSVEKSLAIQNCLNQLIADICIGAVTFDDVANGEPIQQHLQKIFDKAELLQTPWFIGEMIVEDEWLKEKLESIATADAEQALYAEADDIIIRLGSDD